MNQPEKPTADTQAPTLGDEAAWEATNAGFDRLDSEYADPESTAWYGLEDHQQVAVPANSPLSRRIAHQWAGSLREGSDPSKLEFTLQAWPEGALVFDDDPDGGLVASIGAEEEPLEHEVVLATVAHLKVRQQLKDVAAEPPVELATLESALLECWDEFGLVAETRALLGEVNEHLDTPLSPQLREETEAAAARLAANMAKISSISRARLAGSKYAYLTAKEAARVAQEKHLATERAKSEEQRRLIEESQFQAADASARKILVRANRLLSQNQEKTTGSIERF